MKKVIIFTVVAIAASGLIYSSTYKSSNSDNEKIMTAETKHSQSKFPLTVEESCMGVANKTHGVIKNNSAVSSYKDAVVRVSYVKETYSDIKAGLVYKEQTINEVFPPHSEVNVEFEIKAYKDLIPTGWELINATAN